MMEDQVRAVLDRVSGWPAERQQELVRVVLEIEAEIRRALPRYTEELKAIDEGLDGEAASEAEISAAFASSGPPRVEYSRRALSDLIEISTYYAESGNQKTGAPVAFAFVR